MLKRTIAILCVVMFLVMLGFGIIIPSLVYYVQGFQAHPETSTAKFELGVLMALYSAMQFLFTPFWGRLSDRQGRKPILLIGLAGSGVALILFGMARSMTMLFGARALAGMLSAAALPTVKAYAADVTDERSRGHAMGLLGASMGLGFIFGPALGGLLSHWGGEVHYEIPFFLAGGLSLLTVPIAFALLREPSQAPASQVGSAKLTLWNALHHPLAPLFVTAFLNTFIFSGAEVLLALILKERFGGGARELGIMLTLMGFVAVGVQGGVLGRLIRRFREFRLLVGGLVLLAVGMLLVPFTPGIVTLTAVVALAGLGSQIVRPTNASWISKITLTGQGIAMGMMDAFLSLGRIAGPVIAGALYGWHPTLCYLILGGGLLVALALLYPSLAARDYRTDTSETA